MKCIKDVAYETRPHTKYTGTVYTYITDIFVSSNPVCPHHGGLSQTGFIVIGIRIKMTTQTHNDNNLLDLSGSLYL